MTELEFQSILQKHKRVAIHLDKPYAPLSKGQTSMHKGQVKIIREALQKHPHVPVYK